jgi:hypothetical protein
MFLRRFTLAATCILTCLCCAAHADVTVIEGRDILPEGASPVGDYGTIYKLTVTPVKESSPAFKYRFSLPPHETIPGNAITHYLRSLGEHGLDRPWEYWQKETDFEVHDWYKISTKASDIPLDKLKKASDMFRALRNHMRRASMCRNADWGLAVEDLRGVDETVGFLLPSVQSTRSMARAMMLQLRLAIIEKRYDDAVESLRIIYKIGQDVNEMGFLVSGLVGIAEVGMANEGVMMLISSEDAPNMYWALAELPTPIIDQRRAMRLDLSMPLRMFPELMDIRNAKYSKDEWKRLLQKYTGSFSQISAMTGGRKDAKAQPTLSASVALGLAGYSNAKKRMLERGYSSEDVTKMSVAQVLLTDTALDIDMFTQDLEKSIHLPFADAQRFTKEWEQKMDRKSPTRFGAMLTRMIAPATSQVRSAGYRVQAHINLLMAVESLRNHAAVHGKFPESLDKLELPVRENPMTAKPFQYSIEAGKAVIVFERDARQIDRYEISIDK